LRWQALTRAELPEPVTSTTCVAEPTAGTDGQVGTTGAGAVVRRTGARVTAGRGRTVRAGVGRGVGDRVGRGDAVGEGAGEGVADGVTMGVGEAVGAAATVPGRSWQPAARRTAGRSITARRTRQPPFDEKCW
jgi:hypothetical protein